MVDALATRPRDQKAVAILCPQSEPERIKRDRRQSQISRAARLSWRRRLAEDTARRLRDQGHRRAALEVYENDVAAELETLIE